MVTSSLPASAHWSRASFGLREVCKLPTRLPGIKAPHGRRLLVDAALVGAVAARGGTGASRRRAQAAPGGIRRGASEGAPDLRLQSVSPPSASPGACTPLAISAKAMALGVAEAQERLAGQGLLPDLPGTVPASRVRLASC